MADPITKHPARDATLSSCSHEDIPLNRAPRHVAIIMDGNGRWASARGLSRLEGHEAGTRNIRRITYRAGELGIKYLTLWAFSTENWRRPKAEVDGLMRILGEAIESETEELHRQGAQLRHIGDLDALQPDLRQSVLDAMELTRDNDKLVLKGGAMPNTVLDANGVKALAGLPGRDELLATLLGTMQAPIAQFVRTLNEVPGRFVRTMAAVRDQKEQASAEPDTEPVAA